MTVDEIERLPEVQQAALVLQKLEERGLVEPAVAGGWIRAFLTDGSLTDIDASYVGSITFEEGQRILAEVLEELEVDDAARWDVRGFWNAQEAYGVERTEENFLRYYVDSINSVYLAADGRLHDPTGYGFADVVNRLLRLNQYESPTWSPSMTTKVLMALEACRRIVQCGWTPTAETEVALREAVSYWLLLPGDKRSYFVRKLGKKYSASEREVARLVYERYGWGFLFNLIS